MSEDYPKTLMEMEKRFSNNDACRDYLARLRWPNGFICPACGGTNGGLMQRKLWHCRDCDRQTSVLAGTVFQDTHVALTVWFRAMWYMTSQKNGVSAQGLQRVLGLGSYRTAWTMLHKLRRAMVRPGRERLQGLVEVDETYWGAEEKGVIGRKTEEKALIAVAVELKGTRMARIRLARLPNLGSDTLQRFIEYAVDPGSIIRTDGLPAYIGMSGYTHDRQIQKHQPEGEHLLPHVHRIASLLKRWLLGTHQGAMAHNHLDDYLAEFTFRFNRRHSAFRGKLFYRLVQQAIEVSPQPYAAVTKPQPVVSP
jgi:transposase-like protein/ribosomal protein L37AE/L43A